MSCNDGDCFPWGTIPLCQYMHTSDPYKWALYHAVAENIPVWHHAEMYNKLLSYGCVSYICVGTSLFMALLSSYGGPVVACMGTK